MATQVKQGQFINLTTTETEVTFEGYNADPNRPVTIILISGSIQYGVGRLGTPAILNASYQIVSTANATRTIWIPNGNSLRLIGSGGAAVVEITW